MTNEALRAKFRPAMDYKPKTYLILAFFLTLLGCERQTTASAASMDTSRLSPQNQKKFESLTQEEFCSCDSSLTISGCLELRPKCDLAKHFASVIVNGLEDGLDGDTVLAFLSERTIGPFCGKPKTIAITGGIEKKAAKPAITLVEFADFRCSHCRKARHTVHKVLKEYGARVHFIFIPFPLQDHPESVLAAEAVLAANAQKKGWEMHDALFEHQGTFDIPSMKTLARKLGLNVKKFANDLRKHTYRGMVNKLKNAGIAAGVEGTPAFYVNGRPFAPDEELLTFADRFEMELARNQASCK